MTDRVTVSFALGGARTVPAAAGAHRIARLLCAATAAAVLLGLSGCAKTEQPQGRRPPPLVAASAPRQHVFTDRIDAVGTARANEQVTIAAAVTERIERVMFDDGMYVGRGQVLAVLTQAQEQAALRGAQASELQARTQLDRIKSLYDKGFATRALYDQQIAAAAEARAAAAEASAAIGDRVIRAPFSGHASLRTISAGAIVTSGTPLVTISDLSRIKLDFTIPETQLGLIRIGQTVEAVAAAYPDQPFVGRISSIDPVIDPNTRAVLVRAELPNPGARIKPGMLMNVHVSTAERTGLAVPELAVLGEGDKRYVYVLDKDNKATRVAVKTGLRDKGVIEVQGLPANARVVTEGVVKVTDGMTVRLAGDKRHEGGPAPAAKSAS